MTNRVRNKRSGLSIVVDYLGPTNTLPSRLVCRSQSRNMTYNYDHELGFVENSRTCAMKYATDLGWIADWYEGADDKGRFVYVGVDSRRESV